MNLKRATRGGAVAIVAIVFVLPFVFMFTGSLHMPGLPPPDGFEVIPEFVRWANYESVFAFVPLARQIVNSTLIVVVAVPLTVLVASLAGYAIVAARARAQKALIVITVVAMMVPMSALWVPRFVMFRWLGLVDTLAALITPALMATTPFFVLVFALAYSRIPKELFEAARVEGLKELTIWRRVAWPLGKPAAFAVAVLAFVFHWSNFIDALLFLTSEDNYTLPLGLRALQTLEPSNHPILLAAAVIATIPPVIAFALAQRAFFTKTLEGA